MANNKNPPHGRVSAQLATCSNSKKHANDNRNTNDTSIDPPTLAVYFVDQAGLFEHRSIGLIGTYCNPRDAVTSFYNTVCESHWQYGPIPIAEHLQKVVTRLSGVISNISSGALQSFEYLFPASRDDDAVIIGVTHLPIRHDSESDSVLTLKVRRSAVHEKRGVPSAASVLYRRDLSKEVDHV